MDAALYNMRVMHRRHVAPLYRFVYRVFYLWVDIDDVAAATRGRRLFSHNRWNLLSFFDRDHGDEDDAPLRPWVEAVLRRHGIDTGGGAIRLLCLPRVFGFVFNPISLYYCHAPDGGLRAIVAEVRNTFGERHSYVIHEQGKAMNLERSFDRDKRFHVSPFLDVAGFYRFSFDQPDESARVVIHEYKDGERILTATLSGRREPLTDAAIARLMIAMPFHTLGVVIGIHWQALKLWLRGAGYRPKPAAPHEESTG